MTEIDRTPCSEPPCGWLDGLPCDDHQQELDHATGTHETCGKDCEAKFPWDQLRNAILYSAIPGSASMLDELLRRAANRSALMDAHIALMEEAGKRWQRIQELEQRVTELEGELRIGEPWICPCCSKENRRDVCVICETDRPDPEDTE